MSLLITKTTPKDDGFFMPAEFAPQERVWLIWPYRLDNWRDGARPAQAAYAAVTEAISQFCDVTVIATDDTFADCRAQLPDMIEVIALPSNDAWARDIVPTFLINNDGELRACDWHFNAWGGDFDGLYSPWDDDDKLAERLTAKLDIPRYRPDNFVLEGGAFHVDGEGTVLTTRMCLLSEGRNPHLSEAEIETYLKDYLNVEKVLWLDDGIDPDETTGHVDDVACFVRPSEVVCLYTDDPEHPFYDAVQNAHQRLSEMTDAKGRKLTVHKLCCTKDNVTLPKNHDVTHSEHAKDRSSDELCIASYANFLICNDGIIVPQYDDANDALALQQLAAIFPKHHVVGVRTREIVYGGGNIHCITQQQPVTKSSL